MSLISLDFFKRKSIINKLKEKNAVTGECLEQLEEWQQISEVEYQLTWLDNFKAKYLKK